MSALAVRVQEKGQVTIPLEMRRRLGLKKGDLVTFVETDKGILIQPAEVIVSAALEMIGESLKANPMTLEDEAYNLTDLLCSKMGFKKIAMFYQNDDFGKQGLEGVERYLKDKKIDLVAQVSAEVTDRDLSSHVLRLKESGAEAVIMLVMPVQCSIDFE